MLKQFKVVIIMRLRNFIKQQFGFFGKQISDKYGKKCCRYGQDGKPLNPQAVQKVFD